MHIFARQKRTGQECQIKPPRANIYGFARSGSKRILAVIPYQTNVQRDTHFNSPFKSKFHVCHYLVELKPNKKY